MRFPLAVFPSLPVKQLVGQLIYMLSGQRSSQES
jgi:hypothetical protein